MNMFTYGYILDGLGGAKEVHKNKEIKDTTGDHMIWMHLNAAEPQIKEWLLSSIKLPKTVIDDLLSDETRPQYRYYEGGVLTTLRSINFNPGSEPEDMVSLHLWIEKNKIITISKQNVQAIEDIAAKIESKTGPKDGADFMVQLVYEINTRIGDVIVEIEDQVDDVEDMILEDYTRDIRQSLSQARRKILVLRRYIVPQRDMLLKMFAENVLGVNYKVHIRDVSEKLVRCIEDLDVARDRAMLIQEEITNSISEQMNRTMTIMTMISTIFLPLTFLTGLLGINVGGIPGSTNSIAFPIVCILAVIIAIGEYIFFKSKRLL